MNRTNLCLSTAAVILMAGSGASTARGEDKSSAVDFVRDIQPIFQQNCYKCHGQDKQKAELRFDSKELLFQGGQTGPTISVGHAADSLLIRRVLGLGGEDKMPLKEKPLSDEQINLLKAWIDQGANFPDSASVADAKISRHWAYRIPVPPEPPTIKDAGWCRNAIDHFIEARLEKDGLQHAAAADRATLIRRVSLDLIGLPPTVKEVDDFVNDQSPNAYEKVVDRLLASPHYGERWAMPWLDLARYADSEGYERDPLRSIWPYRDWVINSFNKNMPFDEFTIEQLAGDLLPNATDDQKIATGFHRNTMINHEAGSDQGEFFYYALVDRVNTTSTVWLGTTMACAQCHNHKYDPFTQKDFYRLMAYFNGSADEARQVGGSEIQDIGPKLTVERPEAKELKGRLADLQAKLTQSSPQLQAAQAEWEQGLLPKAEWTDLHVTEAKAEGSTLAVQADGSVLASGDLPATDTYTLTVETPLKSITAVELEVLPDDSLPGHGPGRSPNGNFALTHFSMRAEPISGDGDATPVIFDRASADMNQDNWPAEKTIAAKPSKDTGWAILPDIGKRHVAVYEAKTDFGYENGTRLIFRIEQKSSAGQHLIGHFRLLASQSPRPIYITPLPANIRDIVSVAAADRTAPQTDELARYYRSISPILAPARDEIPKLEKRIREATATTLIMQEMPKPRETHLHIRGAYLNVGDAVDPGTPAIFVDRHKAADPSPSGRQTRLDFARWLVGPENPLTARVTMNRIWEQYFGIGIVKTSEDFGTQGDPPSNQALLDWLACELVSRHWDLKQMHKVIVMSATYGQSSDVTPELQEKDPANRLLARGPRFRLPAELIRDQAMATSGLLSETIGGPGVFPVQPDGIWKNPYSGDSWNTSSGGDRFRRGLYTFMRRSTPYPQFMAFDMTPHEAICARRSRTNTPLQALTALNDPAFMQPAAALARRAAKDGGADDRQRATFLFRSVLSRTPENGEVTRLVELHDELLKAYSQDADAARKMADSGLGDLPKDVPVAELAAWTVIANTVLNLDETLTKG